MELLSLEFWVFTLKLSVDLSSPLLMLKVFLLVLGASIVVAFKITGIITYYSIKIHFLVKRETSKDKKDKEEPPQS